MHRALLLGAHALLRKERAAESLDPYDCYVEDDAGEGYPGLQDMTESGRSCQYWSGQKPHAHSYTGADKGMGNHNYCRNPGQSKARPWCYTQDTSKEWEYCKIPVCTPASETPEAWTAPEGLRSEGVEPCEWVDDRVMYEDFEVVLEGKVLDPGSCRSKMGGNYWLIGNSGASMNVTGGNNTAGLFEATDEAACVQECLQTPGATFATHWTTPFDSGANCGCYRNCIPTEDPADGAINGPNVFKLTMSLLEEGAETHPARAATHAKHHKKRPCPRKASSQKKQPDIWKLARERVAKLAAADKAAANSAFLALAP